MTISKILTRFLPAILVLAAGIASASGQVTLPAGVTVGETYRLVFLTASSTNSQSNNIADYNTFVTAQADSDPALAALDTTWTAIASTTSVSATANTSSAPTLSLQYPIYNLGGALVASNYTSFWGTSNPTPALDAPIDITQTGANDGSVGVWTGSYINGSEDAGYTLGSNTTNGVLGFSSYTDDQFLYTGSDTHNFLFQMYAISAPILAVPEPNGGVIFALGLGIVGLLRLRRARA